MLPYVLLTVRGAAGTSLSLPIVDSPVLQPTNARGSPKSHSEVAAVIRLRSHAADQLTSIDGCLADCLTESWFPLTLGVSRNVGYRPCFSGTKTTFHPIPGRCETYIPDSRAMKAAVVHKHSALFISTLPPHSPSSLTLLARFFLRSSL